ncbi:MAG: NYN domain-containing protein [bacterium]|nr:NYN domain-containing protein [bacterium]
MLNFEHQRVGVFIDTQNMYYSGRNLFGKKVNFENIVTEAVGNRRIVRATAYVVSTKTGEENPFFEALEKTGIQLRRKELVQYLSGIKKADWDVGIAVDVIGALETLDVVVLVSGDGDFVQLGQYVKSRGRRFEVISFRETTSSNLVEWADRYTNLSDDKRKFLIGKARSPAAKMTKGGEVFVEKDQEGAMSETPIKKRTPIKRPAAKKALNRPAQKPTVSKDNKEEEDSRSRRLSF